MSHQNKWTERDIPDLQGRVAIVTVSNSGIGYATARALAHKGASVVMACRNPDKAEAAASRIGGESPSGTAEPMDLDLADLDSVGRFAIAFEQEYDRLDLLINNAGIMMPKLGRTVQGFETQFGVNHLGHFALTGLLLDSILQTPGSRIVTVSSLTYRYAKLDFDDLNWQSRRYNAGAAYGQSKLANLLFAYELKRRLESAGHDGLSAAAHPGWTATNLPRYSGVMLFFHRLLAQDTAMGALPSLYAATVSDMEGGSFYGPDGLMELRGHPKKANSNGRSHDHAVAEQLWRASEELTNVVYGL